jgi:16S rRNA (guanine527-N7)-methyltransferase
MADHDHPPGDGPPLLAIRGPEDFAAAFGVSRETLDRLAAYEALLRQWQKAVNLVAPGTLVAVWHRHFADSAQLLPLVPWHPQHWLDLGSGAGFPGLVIAILLADTREPPAVGVPSPLRGGARGGGNPNDHREEATKPPAQPGGLPRVTLVESDARKAAFLREVARQTGIAATVRVDILSTRAESLPTQVNLPLPDVVSARALAPLDRLLGLAAPFLSPPGAVGVFCKGKEVAKELRAAEKTWQFKAELVPSRTEKEGRIVVIRQLERKAKV